MEIRELCRLLNIGWVAKPSPQCCRSRIEQAIKAGILTQEGIVEPQAGPRWAKDTMTAELPMVGT